MTNRQYFLAQIGFAPSDETVEAALSDAGHLGITTYDPANKIAIKTAALGVVRILFSTADVVQGVGETANSIKYDRPSLLKLIEKLEGELGLTTGAPTITSRRVW